VVTIGFVLGQFQNSVSVGVVSGLSRSINADNGQGMSEHLDRVIQTDAAINPGNSGGPLLNLRGEVVGVNVATAQGVQSIGFALPINEVKTAIDSVKKHGSIVRPYVGIYYIDIDSDIQMQYGLPVSSGTLVKRTLPAGASGSIATQAMSAVIPGSPAEKAGIQDGDIITSIDGKALVGATSFASIIRQKNVGSKVTFTLLRNGEIHTVIVTLATAS
jgi:S1-C subfamily serine protease